MPEIGNLLFQFGEAVGVGKRVGATRLQDRGLPHRIVDGLRPGHARLCEAWKNTGRVDKLAAQAMSCAEVKELLGVDEFLRLRERL
jgi:hypothetical protein